MNHLKLNENMLGVIREQAVVEMVFGSHLYGTNTEDSDKDYKGVYFPSLDDILLQRVPKSIKFSTKKDFIERKNTKHDIEYEYYSFFYFIELACKGETVALDMLHAPLPLLTRTSVLWQAITENRSKFYTKNLSAFIGYARKQAAKYGVKGSRLNDAKRVLDFLKAQNQYSFHGTFGRKEYKRLHHIWDELPKGEHIHFPDPEEGYMRMYEVCGRKIQENSDISYAIEIVQKFYDNYGHRARQAANNEGIDWKAISHALRAAYQIKDIFTNGNIYFPLPQADYIRKVKSGELHYMNDVAPVLEKLMEECEELSKESILPNKVDRKFWDLFIIKQTVLWHKLAMYDGSIY